MSFIIAFLTALLGIPASLWISSNESACRTSEFPTLLYHHIREYSSLIDEEAKNLSVSPEEFEKQMQYLHKNQFTAITSKDIIHNTVPCKSVMITFDDGYYDVYTRAYPIMKKYNYVWVIGIILAKVDESDYLFWSDIQKLQKAGWEIASHTWHHPNLSTLSEQYIPYQIGQSKKDLEKWFDTTVNIFVYPGGRYTYATLDQIKISGYQYAFTTQSGKTNLLKPHLELKRIDILPSTSLEKFKTLITGETVGTTVQK